VLEKKINEMALRQISVEQLDKSYTETPSKMLSLTKDEPEDKPSQIFSHQAGIDEVGGSSSDDTRVREPVVQQQSSIVSLDLRKREEPPIEDPYTDH